jgi:hypothetical protein
VSLGPGGHVPNNRSFLGTRGGLFDGPLTYAFLPGRERLPAHVRWEVPAGWQLVTGLEPTSDPRTFVARSVDVLLDAPVLAGPAPAVRSWRFAVDGVPHRVALWSGRRRDTVRHHALRRRRRHHRAHGAGADGRAAVPRVRLPLRRRRGRGARAPQLDDRSACPPRASRAIRRVGRR